MVGRQECTKATGAGACLRRERHSGRRRAPWERLGDEHNLCASPGVGYSFQIHMQVLKHPSKKMGVAAAAVNSVVTWLLLCQPSALAALPTIKEEARPSSSPSSLAGAAALGRHEPQHASASHGRELQSSGCLCLDTCGYWASNGYCDDGGPGSSSSLCSPGTDCSDCGPHCTPPPPPSPPQPPPTPLPPSAPSPGCLCADTCYYAHGYCNDGGSAV